MATYYRHELSMLMKKIADYSADLLKASSKRERLLIESNISVTLAEIDDCFADFLCETMTEEM